MKCGYIALVGRPNTGKSTLLNHLLGQKISITSRKPQTTRHRILGIKSCAQSQLIFLDTPGMHINETKALNRRLNKTADATLLGVDLVVWLVDDTVLTEADQYVLSKLQRAGLPVIFALNKVDKIKQKDKILRFFSEVQNSFAFQQLIPISALKGVNLDRLEQCILDLLPEGDPVYDDDQITDRSVRFMAAEIVREKLTRRLGDELPYALTVQIEKFEESDALAKIYAVIWVERQTQKTIVIGKQGETLKRIGTEARQDIEKLLEKKVYLQLWVKIKKSWSDCDKSLNSLGIVD